MTTTGSQCTASSYTASAIITSTFSTIGQWDTNNSAGKGIAIENDSVVSDATSAALVVGGGNSKQVVVRDQTFDVNALAGLRFGSPGASLDTSSSSTFCRSTFVGSGHGVDSKGSLIIVDSTLEGYGSGGIGYNGLDVGAGSNTVIVGKSTRIKAGDGGNVVWMRDGASIDIHEGIFGDDEIYFSPLYVQGGTANIYGGEWKKQLYSVGGSGPNTINLYRDVNDSSLLCDGNAVPTVKIASGGAGPNYLDCPQDYSVPTFPECE